MIGSLFGVLFDGFAYGMLLFLLSVGLSVTLGMMNFVNLAHCAFAMLGGYVTVTLMNGFKWPFFATLFQTGMRLGEVQGLRGADIRLSEGRILIQEATREVEGRALVAPGDGEVVVPCHPRAEQLITVVERGRSRGEDRAP